MKKKNIISKNIITSVLLATSLSLSSCGNITDSTKKTEESNEESIQVANEEENMQKENEMESEVNNPKPLEATSINSASDNLFIQTLFAENDENSNVLISPYSIIMDFGMLENGAKGDTLNEFIKYLNGGLSVNELNDFMKTTKEQMMNSNLVSWNVANSIWINENYASSLNEDVEKIVKDYYSSVINKRPYNNETLEEINKWVNDNTNEMIPSILDEINDTQVMHLINAIAFEGDWAEKIQAENIINDYDFTNLDGSISKVDMLPSIVNGYFSSDNFDGFTKAFTDENYAFFAIKPKNNLTPKELMNNLKENGETISSIMNDYSIDGVAAVKIPKFTFDYETSLNQILKNAGIKKAFSEDADFSGLGVVDNLFISKTKHKAHFEISETGVKAAAATVITMKENGILVEDPVTPYEITLDSPFIYGIYDKTNNLPIFIGCQNVIDESEE